MNKLNDIFKKVAELEKNAQEVKLGIHVELGAVDEIQSIVKDSANIYNQFLSSDNLIKPNLQKAQDEAKKAFSLLNKYIDNIENAKNMISKVENQLKELGIDAKTAFGNNYGTIEKIKSLNTNDWNNWKNNYNAFIKTQAPNI